MSIPPPPGPQQPEGHHPQPGPGPYPQDARPQNPSVPDPAAHDPSVPDPAASNPYAQSPYQPGLHGPQPYAQQPYGQQPYGQQPYTSGAAAAPAAYGPYGPYGQPPHPAWGQNPVPYGQSAPVNGLAISSLVLGVLCCLPGVGLVLGVIGLRQIKRRGERGRGMAVGGSVLSVIGLLLWALVLGTGAADEAWKGFKEGTRNSTVFSLSKGECVNAPDGSLKGEAYDLTEVDCAKQHDAEVFASYDLPDGSYPGKDTMGGTAGDRCYALRADYAMDAWAVPDYVDVYYLTPTPESWSTGDHEVTCLFGNTVEGEPLTGSLRNDETVLDADQVAYLKSANAVNAVLDTEPGTGYVEEDLPGHRAWARRVSTALAAQSGKLRARDWPQAVSGPVAALAGDLDKARGEWAKAAEATDADTFYVHYEKGYELLQSDRTVTARKALGLATTPPQDPGSGGSKGGSPGSGGVEV